MANKNATRKLGQNADNKILDNILKFKQISFRCVLKIDVTQSFFSHKDYCGEEINTKHRK